MRSQSIDARAGALAFMAYALFACGSNAHAQSATQQQDAAVVDSGDIIVTARKREERLQDVPVAISVLTGEDIRRYGTQSMSQLAVQVPSLVAGVSSNTAAGGTISLRGIGSPATGLMVDQAVSLNIDGVQISKAFALRLGVFDIARTEVLKGPQALFFGKNSPGGIISLISADPGSKFEAMLRGGYEFAAHKKYVEGMVSTPLTDTLGIRVTGAFADSRGWFINTAEPLPALTIPAFLGGGSTPPQIGASNRHGPSVKDYFARATLNFDPSDAFDAKLKMSYSRSDQKDGPTIGNQLFACANGGPFYAELLNSPASRDCRINRYVDDADFPVGVTALSPMLRNGRLFVEDRQFLASLAANFHLSDQITLSSVTGYYDLTNRYLSNFSFGGQAYLGGRYDLHDKQFTQELRLSSDFSSPFNFLVGAFYQNEKANANGLTFTDSLYTGLFTGFAVPPSPQILLAGDVSQKTTAWSVFGQAIVDVTDKVQLTAGGRFSREKKRAAAGVDPNISAPTPYEVILTPSGRTFENFSPEITLTYKPVPNATIYGSYRHGFKSGGFDLTFSTGQFGQANAGDISYEPEKVKGGEIGMKGTFLDRQLLLDLAAYTFKYTDLQVAAFNPRLFANVLTNAGSARTRGIDMSATFRPRQIEGLTLRSAVNYNRARYIRFDTGPCYPGQSQAQGCNLVVTAGPDGDAVITPAGPATVGNAQDLSGRTLHRAPKWALQLGGSYEQPIGHMKLILSADGNHTGRYQAMPDQDPRALARSAWRLNASVALQGPQDRWEVALIGTNLTQVFRPLNAIAYAATGSGTGTPMSTASDLQADYLEPRAITLQMTYRF